VLLASDERPLSSVGVANPANHERRVSWNEATFAEWSRSDGLAPFAAISRRALAFKRLPRSGAFDARRDRSLQQACGAIDESTYDRGGNTAERMSLTPDSVLSNLQQTVGGLQRQLGGALAEREDALVRETATAEVLQVINSSPGDLAPVFDAILESARRLCKAEVGTLWAFDGEQSRVVANRGAPPAYAEFLNQGPQPRTALAASAVHIADITTGREKRWDCPGGL